MYLNIKYIVMFITVIILYYIVVLYVLYIITNITYIKVNYLPNFVLLRISLILRVYTTADLISFHLVVFAITR
jgi:hypothetical protein